MLDNKSVIIIEDTKQYRYMFFHRNESIYCREISKNNRIRETLLAAQVSSDFQAAIDSEDTIYIICNSREKGIIILSYQKGSWRLNQVLNIQNYSNVSILKAYVSKKVLHILYAKKLPIANFYNIHHIYSSGSEVLNNAWKRNSITEVYSENLSTSVAAAITRNNDIHLANVWFDGSSYTITHCQFDASRDTWSKKSITKLFDKSINVQLLTDKYKLHLFCHSMEDDLSVVFYFSKNEKGDFEFVSLNKINVSTDICPLFFIDNNRIFSAWTANNSYYEIVLKENLKEWSDIKEYHIESELFLKEVEYITNNERHGARYKKLYMLIDEDNNILMPWQYKEMKSLSKDNRNTVIQDKDDTESTEYLRHTSYIISEIERLKSSIRDLNEKLEELLDDKTKAQHYSSYTDNYRTAESTKALNTDLKSMTLKKKSNFKERFMNSQTKFHSPESAAIYVAKGSLPNENVNNHKRSDISGISTKEASTTVNKQSQETDSANAQDITPGGAESDMNDKPDNESDENRHGNLIKKLGEIFK
ncbi:MAG: hypothetical protein ACOZCL_01390 [Bacillota bacterium]